MAAPKVFEVNEVDAYMIAQALEVKVAQIKRSLNAASDAELKAVYNRQLLAFLDLSRKFPVKG